MQNLIYKKLGLDKLLPDRLSKGFSKMTDYLTSAKKLVEHQTKMQQEAKDRADLAEKTIQENQKNGMVQPNPKADEPLS